MSGQRAAAPARGAVRGRVHRPVRRRHGHRADPRAARRVRRLDRDRVARADELPGALRRAAAGLRARSASASAAPAPRGVAFMVYAACLGRRRAGRPASSPSSSPGRSRAPRTRSPRRWSWRRSPTSPRSATSAARWAPSPPCRPRASSARRWSAAWRARSTTGWRSSPPRSRRSALALLSTPRGAGGGRGGPRRGAALRRRPHAAQTRWTARAAFLAYLGDHRPGVVVALRAGDAFGLGPTARGAAARRLRRCGRRRGAARRRPQPTARRGARRPRRRAGVRRARAAAGRGRRRGRARAVWLAAGVASALLWAGLNVLTVGRRAREPRRRRLADRRLQVHRQRARAGRAAPALRRRRRAGVRGAPCASCSR